MLLRRNDRANRLPYRDGAHLSRVLFARGIQGILLAQLFPPHLLLEMDLQPFSVVALGEGFVAPASSPLHSLNRSSVDHFGLVQQAWSEALNRRYRRVGVVLFQHSLPLADDDARFGAVAACQVRTLEADRIPPLISDFKFESLQHRTVEWIQQNRPDVIIGYNSWVLVVLEEAGFRVPEDFGFVTLHTTWGDSDAGTFFPERVCGMKEMVVERMHAALELLDQQIRHHQYGLDPRARTALIHSEWFEGDTLPPKDTR